MSCASNKQHSQVAASSGHKDLPVLIHTDFDNLNNLQYLLFMSRQGRDEKFMLPIHCRAAL